MIKWEFYNYLTTQSRINITSHLLNKKVYHSALFIPKKRVNEHFSHKEERNYSSKISMRLTNSCSVVLWLEGMSITWLNHENINRKGWKKGKTKNKNWVMK